MSEPSRRVVLATSLAALAGCLERGGGERATPESGSQSSPSPTPTPAEVSRPVAEQFDCAGASRPDPDIEAGVEVEYEDSDGDTRTYVSVGSTEYPDPPDWGPDETPDADAVETYVREHEEAFLWNRQAARYEEGLWEFHVDFQDVEVRDRRESVTFVRLGTVVTASFIDGRDPLAGHWFVEAEYAIDATGAARSELDPHENGDADPPDPLADGRLVACF